MAHQNRIPGAGVSGHVSTSVTTITLDSAGNYSSGGIPFGAAVKEDTTGSAKDVVIQGTTGGDIFGIAQSDPAAGPDEAILIETVGIVKALAGGVIAYGDQVYVGDAQGRLIKVPGSPAAGSYAVGYAETPAAAAGDLFSVRLARAKVA